MEKKKIGKAKGHTVSKATAKKGAAAMSEAMTSRVNKAPASKRAKSKY